MGNSPSGLRLLGNGKYSYDIKLGKAASISVKTGRIKEKENSFSRSQTWELSYNVDRITTCTLSIVKTTKTVPAEEKLLINIKDYIPEANNRHIKEKHAALPTHPTELFSITLQKDDEEDGVLDVAFHQSCRYLEPDYMKKRRERSTAGTSFYAYGYGSRMGVFVMEKKKRSNEKQPYMVTLAHYYVNSGRGVDIGFSVLVKIGVQNGELDFSVEGPEEHPSLALLYMIEEVVRSGKWKRSACPHCKNLQQWQRRWVSESEDSDTNVPTPAASHGGQQNASNKGRFSGDGIGSMIHANKVNFNKWWT
ncbi:uncharacterized protein LOC114181168 [Vigna unguiculata]|uniref:uncharacterized protein LOC114181168 n=1 Tax=Vigna unguiculata TaxID=3917 RepID=UPI00101648DB|nr:uncharacterized protein LOC114181168 [Vigna unguiculata]